MGGKGGAGKVVAAPLGTGGLCRWDVLGDRWGAGLAVGGSLRWLEPQVDAGRIIRAAGQEGGKATCNGEEDEAPPRKGTGLSLSLPDVAAWGRSVSAGALGTRRQVQGGGESHPAEV